MNDEITFCKKLYKYGVLKCLENYTTVSFISVESEKTMASSIATALIVCIVLIVAVSGASTNLRSNKPGENVGKPAKKCNHVGELIPDDYDCHAFYECTVLLQPEPFKCPDLTCFYSETNKCELENQGKCHCIYE
ncbi:hypothetical protein CHUAL_008730 [Chamberlinius hualienensis]